MSYDLLDKPATAYGFSAECRPCAGGLASYCSWSGASGRRHVATIYGFDACPDIEDAVAFAVRREANGARRILAAADLGPLPMVVLGGETFRAAKARGANEIHLHLLARDPKERVRIIADCAGRER